MISEELQEIIDEAEMHMEEATAFFKKELSHVRAGKANPALLEGIKVEYYGSKTPLQQLANVSAPEPRLLVVQPYDRSGMEDIEKAIMSAGLGLNPSNDGDRILIPLPVLTEERRRELVKHSKDIAEQARISIRNSRRNANDSVKKTVESESLSEDSKYEAEDEIQKLTDSYIAKVEEMLEKKEKEIMTV
ncbi:ribosome recycling factor [Gracilimonas amylolytica]|uniref:ribosome recycling factor n=1 Tax=Gracilimonas amylolytica TaxID=1749045 RepID=UPI000CD7F2C0|nr:ribosome recycling factor [Gracilimonas amylolytica]